MQALVEFKTRSKCPFSHKDLVCFTFSNGDFGGFQTGGNTVLLNLPPLRPALHPAIALLVSQPRPHLPHFPFHTLKRTNT